MKIQIGTTLEDEPVKLDLMTLVESRAIIQASSGGGKSWLLRVLAEQIMPHLPVIILDREGEFATLREKFDLVIVGGNGEVPADVKSAGLLAHKLIELRTSAAINLYDLGHAKRPAFVKNFLDALIDVPKRYWRPTVIIIDEAHQFCPQDGSAESTESVIRLQDQGRKRSFCGILATQRLSKLDKDAAAEGKNKFIGWTDPIDQKRAADTLGIPPKDRVAFSRFGKGEWWGFGPAIGIRDVVKFISAGVQTTHPKPGQMRNAPAPSPSHAILKVLPELQELSKAEDQPTTIDEAQKAITKLKSEISKLSKAKQAVAPSVAATTDPKAIERAVVARDRHWQQQLGQQQKVIDGLIGRIGKIGEAVGKLCHLNGSAKVSITPPPPLPVAASRPPVNRIEPAVNVNNCSHSKSVPVTAAAAGMDGPTKNLLYSLAWWRSLNVDEPTAGQAGAVAGYTVVRTLNNYLSKMVNAGLIRRTRSGVRLTDAGTAIAPAVEAPEDLSELHLKVIETLDGPGQAIIKVALNTEGAELSLEDVGEATGYTVTRTLNNYISKLVKRGLIERGRGTIKATEVLFPPALV